MTVCVPCRCRTRLRLLDAAQVVSADGSECRDVRRPLLCGDVPGNHRVARQPDGTLAAVSRRRRRAPGERPPAGPRPTPAVWRQQQVHHRAPGRGDTAGGRWRSAGVVHVLMLVFSSIGRSAGIVHVLMLVFSSIGRSAGIVHVLVLVFSSIGRSAGIVHVLVLVFSSIGQSAGVVHVFVLVFSSIGRSAGVVRVLVFVFSSIGRSAGVVQRFGVGF